MFYQNTRCLELGMNLKINKHMIFLQGENQCDSKCLNKSYKC